MKLRMPFFGIVSLKSPLAGLLEHYEQIVKGMVLIEESMECYISGGQGTACKEFNGLLAELFALEEHADTIKRYIRNHLPRSIFLPVDKHVFFSYTRIQDEILNDGLESLHWLAMRDVVVPEAFQKDILYFLCDVNTSVKLLRPALEMTLAWVTDESVERDEVKEQFRNLRLHHKEVTKKKQELSSKLYRSDLDFKDIYQLIRFVERLHCMSHGAEDCVDLLRVMIAK